MVVAGGDTEKGKLVATGWGTVSAEGGDGFLHIIRPVRCKRVTAEQKLAWGRGGGGGVNFY